MLRKNISDLTISPSSSIQEGMRVINENSANVCLVLDEGTLVGVVTDGDIRRGLLRGEALESSISSVMQKDFVKVVPSTTVTEAVTVMRKRSLRQVPVVDDASKLIGLYVFDDCVEIDKLPNRVIIMAGGLGTRLRPLTDNCPKPMLKVGGRPILEIILQQCVEAGFKNYFFSVNYLKEQIKDYFQDGANWGVEIKYLEESAPLGTAGALSLLPTRSVHPMLVINGDVLTRIDYRDLLQFHAEQSGVATMCVRNYTTRIPYGVVNTKNSEVLSFDEKPVLTHQVNAGVYLLDPEILDYVPKEQYVDMPSLLEMVNKAEKTVNAFFLHEYWLDVGYPETLQQASSEW